MLRPGRGVPFVTLLLCTLIPLGCTGARADPEAIVLRARDALEAGDWGAFESLLSPAAKERLTTRLPYRDLSPDAPDPLVPWRTVGDLGENERIAALIEERTYCEAVVGPILGRFEVVSSRILRERAIVELDTPAGATEIRLQFVAGVWKLDL